MRRIDLREPVEHVQLAVRRAGEPENRTAMPFGCRSFGIAADASAPPVFESLLALATTFHPEDEHALMATATASTNAVKPDAFTE